MGLDYPEQGECLGPMGDAVDASESPGKTETCNGMAPPNMARRLSADPMPDAWWSMPTSFAAIRGFC